MKIIPHYNYNSRINFTSFNDETKSAKGDTIMHSTYYYRRDLPWNDTVDFMIDKYRNADKVHVINYGCSDGSESDALVMLLKEKLGKGAEKFEPVIASDLVPKAVEAAKNPKVYLHDTDIEAINKHTNNKFEHYFVELTESDDWEYDYMAKRSDSLKNSVIYDVADLTKDIKNKKPDNTVLICRNLWPYLENNEVRRTLALDMYNSLGNNATVIIGEFDDNNFKNFCATNLLLEAGFKQTNIPRVLEKVPFVEYIPQLAKKIRL